MASIVYLTNKKTGKVYAYINEKVYDESERRYRYRRRCIGHIDESGALVENRAKVQSGDPIAVSVGIDMYLSRISEDCGLTSSLRLAFPEDWRLILTCAMYIVAEDMPLSLMDTWSDRNRTPFGKKVVHKDLEDLLSHIDTSMCQAFMGIWRKKVDDSEFVTVFTKYTSISAMDSTGSVAGSLGISDVPSEIVMYFGRRTTLPIAYIRNSVPSRNLRAADRVIDDAYWIDVPRPIKVMDRDYCTSVNVGDAIDEGKGFMLILPNSDRYAGEEINDARDTIVDPSNYYTRPDGLRGFVRTRRIPGERPLYRHLFYSEEDAEVDMGSFFTILDLCRQELESGIMVPGHVQYYSRFFLSQGSRESARVEINSDRAMEYASAAGFLAILSDTVSDPFEAVMWSVKMKRCSGTFSKMKNPIDSPRLKLFSEHNSGSRMFIQVIAFVLASAVANNLEEGSLLRDFTVQSAVKELSGLMEVSGMGHKTPRMTGMNYLQEMLLKNAGITVR